MKTPPRQAMLLIALALAGCRADPTGTPPGAVTSSLLASRHEADDPPRFSNWSAPVNLGSVVNTSFIEQGPSISKNGLSLYFQCGNCPTNIGGADIFVSQRASVSDPWGLPQRLGSAINTTSNEQAPSLSRDGHRLFFNSDRPNGFGGHDLYVARRQDTHDDFAWEPPVNLGAGVNTTQDDVQGDPFEDDETDTNILYFSSGPGGTDIYVSVLLADGTYGPRALVTELNSTANDRQPSIRRDGLEMFLGSDRLGTLGALDLWVATRARTSDPWSAPVNLGPVVNTTQVDGRPALSSDGTTLYFQSTRPGAVGCASGAACIFDFWVTTRARLDDADDDDNDARVSTPWEEKQR
jgi:WD40 repeat protein